MPVPTVQEVNDFKTDLDDAESLVNGFSTVSTRLGGNKDSYSQLVGRIAHGDITTYNSGTTYTLITDWVEESSKVYRPIPSDLPIGPETFDPTKWIIVQGYTIDDAISPPVDNYVALKALNSSPIPVGTVITVTDDGIAGDFVVKLGNVTEDGGTIFPFDDAPTTKYVERIYESRVNVLWYECIGDGVFDNTINMRKAFGGDGTTPDNWSVYVPNGTYLCNNPRAWRDGEILRNFSLEGESVDGVFFKQVSASKGFIFGEPSAAIVAGYGAGTGINTIGVQVRNITHQYDDIGFWFVYCKGVLAENIKGLDLLVAVSGNDGDNECEDVTFRNMERMNNGRNVTPDNWYSIATFQTTNFRLDGYHSNGFVPSQSLGGGGNHINLNTTKDAHVTNCVIHHDDLGVIRSQGILLGPGCKNITVSNNTIRDCDEGIVTFGLTTNDNLFTGNNVQDCVKGVNFQSPLNTFTGNVIRNNSSKDIFNANSDGSPNTFIGNEFDTVEIENTIESSQTFLANKNFRRIFIPGHIFQAYFTTPSAPTLDLTNHRLLDTVGGERFIAFCPLPHSGEIRNVTFIVNRLISSTAITCVINLKGHTGGSTDQGATADGSAAGFLNIPVTPGTNPLPINKRQTLHFVYIMAAANVGELVGVEFEYRPTLGDGHIDT